MMPSVVKAQNLIRDSYSSAPIDAEWEKLRVTGKYSPLETRPHEKYTDSSNGTKGALG